MYDVWKSYVPRSSIFNAIAIVTIFHLLRENCIQFCKNKAKTKGCEIKSAYPQRILETLKVYRFTSAPFIYFPLSAAILSLQCLVS